MARNIVDVIDQVLAVIPEGNEIAVNELKSLRSTCVYSPPEQILLLWNLFSEKMNYVVSQPPVVVEWEIKAIAIFMDKTEEQIQALFGAKETEK